MAATKSKLYIYYFVIFNLSLGLCYFFHRLTSNQPEDHLYVEKCVLCAISSFFNLFVLQYHYSHAPHPKFVILPRRQISIYVHIISGVLEFSMCWIAFLTGSPLISTIAAVIALLGHVPTSYYQTSIVFGAKALMVAGYLFSISLHLFCAIQLFLKPSSVYWLLNMFLVHNIYVWCRVFYFFFGFTGLFRHTVYTNAILTSGLILFSSVLGVAANMLFLGYVGASILLYLAIVQPNEAERARFVSENTRDILINRAAHNAWIRQKMALMKLGDDDKLTDQQRAKRVFDEFDANKNGTIEGREIIKLLEQWEVSQTFINSLSRFSKKNEITFSFFYRNIWRLGQTSQVHLREGSIRESKSKAQFIFDIIDTDKSGYIDRIELQSLLIQWGLPDNEAEDYLADDDDKRFSFDEFYQNLKPIWEFAFDNLFVKEAADATQPSEAEDLNKQNPENKIKQF